MSKYREMEVSRLCNVYGDLTEKLANLEERECRAESLCRVYSPYVRFAEQLQVIRQEKTELLPVVQRTKVLLADAMEDLAAERELDEAAENIDEVIDGNEDTDTTTAFQPDFGADLGDSATNQNPAD